MYNHYSLVEETRAFLFLVGLINIYFWVWEAYNRIH